MKNMCVASNLLAMASILIRMVSGPIQNSLKTHYISLQFVTIYIHIELQDISYTANFSLSTILGVTRME